MTEGHKISCRCESCARLWQEFKLTPRYAEQAKHADELNVAWQKLNFGPDLP